LANLYSAQITLFINGFTQIFHGKQKYWIIFSSCKHFSSHFCLHRTMQ